jgi:hypothetical protein
MDPEKYRSSGAVEPRSPHIEVEAVFILWFNDIQGIEDAWWRRNLGCDLCEFKGRTYTLPWLYFFWWHPPEWPGRGCGIRHTLEYEQTFQITAFHFSNPGLNYGSHFFSISFHF